MSNAASKTATRVETTPHMRRVLVAALLDAATMSIRSRHLPAMVGRRGLAGYGSTFKGLEAKGFAKGGVLTPAGIEKAKAIKAAMTGDEWWAP